METITVKVGMLPGRIEEVVVDANSTAGDAIAAAELNPEGFTILVDGAVGTVETPVRNGSAVFLAKKVKGNQNLVKVGMLPGRIQEVVVPNGATAGNAIEVAELDPEGFTILVDGAVGTVETPVRNGSAVFLARKVKGNQ